MGQHGQYPSFDSYNQVCCISLSHGALGQHLKSKNKQLVSYTNVAARLKLTINVSCPQVIGSVSLCIELARACFDVVLLSANGLK